MTARIVIMTLVAHPSNADGSYRYEDGVVLPGGTLTTSGTRADALVAAAPGAWTVTSDSPDYTDMETAVLAAQAAQAAAEAAVLDSFRVEAAADGLTTTYDLGHADTFGHTVYLDGLAQPSSTYTISLGTGPGDVDQVELEAAPSAGVGVEITYLAP